MYVSLYKLSIERYYIEGLYEVTYNCITFGLSGTTTGTRQPRQRPPPAPASRSADQKTAEPPPGSSAVCHSRKVASQSR